MHRVPSEIDPTLHYRALPFAPDDAGLLAYFTLRAQVFSAYGMDYYTDRPDAYDRHPDTRFILLEDGGGTLLGGRRILLHEPGSDTRLKTDDTIPTPLRQMLSHLDLRPLRYGELTSLALADAARGRGLAAELYDVTFEYCRQRQLDFIVVEAVPTNIRGFIGAATRAGAKQIVPRPDVRSIDGDEDFRIFATLSPESALPLLSDTDKNAGLGHMLDAQEIDDLIRYREALKQGRRT